MDDSHLAGPKGQLKYICSLMGMVTGVALLIGLLLGIWVPMYGAIMGWIVVGVYTLILFFVIEPAGDAMPYSAQGALLAQLCHR